MNEEAKRPRRVKEAAATYGLQIGGTSQQTNAAEADRICTELGAMRRELAAVKAQLVQVTEIRQELAAVKTQLAQVAEIRQQGNITEHPYVVRNPQMHRGEPTVRGSSITVRTVVERTRLGDTPEQIVDAYPVLALAQVHDALGYYYDHPGEIEEYIHENREALWRTKQPASS